MLNVLHAVLHVFDFEAGTATFSRRELDLGSRPVVSYVRSFLRKAANSAESRHGEFQPTSGFVGELDQYLDGRRDFVDLSVQIGQFLFEEIRRSDAPEQCDLLVADFEDEAAPGAGTKVDVAGNAEVGDGADFADAVDAAMQQALEASYEGHGDRKFALILLPRKKAFMHEMEGSDGSAYNELLRNDAALPNPTQKVDCYAVVNTRTMAIDFSDKPRMVAGEERYVIPDGLLQCSTHASTREVIQQVTSIVEEVANEYGANATVAVSKAKALVSENAGESETLLPWDIGDEVFEDAPQMRERYQQRTREADLPERVQVKRSVATRMAKSQKIRTDTGIEITFPSEYSATSDFIAFLTQPDGSINIEIKGIGKIENR